MNNKNVILIGAPWCGACKSMRDGWFVTLDMPGVIFSYKDIAEVAEENIASVPVILLQENGMTLQTLYGAISKHELEHQIHSLWPEL